MRGFVLGDNLLITCQLHKHDKSHKYPIRLTQLIKLLVT
jgi:hypothetical protein